MPTVSNKTTMLPEMVHIKSWILIMLGILYVAVIIASVIVVLRENRNPIRALVWVLALLFLPGVGFVFYLFFGRSLKGKAHDLAS